MKKYINLYEKELYNCIDFWLKHSVDNKNGGIINCVDRKGEVYSLDKSVWMQGRAGYMFSYLYNNIKKDKTYLNLAKSCIDFAKKYCIDSDGRMFFTVTSDGKPLRKRRYFFSETFYIIANAECYIATKEEDYLTEAKKYFDFVYSIYKNPNLDPYKITPKFYSETRSLKSLANPMILLNVASVIRNADKTRKSYYDEIIAGLIEDIKKFYSKDFNAVFENVGTNNEFLLDNASSRITNPGHTIECSWFLLEEAVKNKDMELFGFAKKIFDSAFNIGWDKKYGGLLYFKDLLNKPVEAYEHDMKLWWTHNECMIASLMLYKYTKDKKYFKIFKKVTKYAFSHFSDKKYGEWYGYLRRDGKPTEPICKGHTYKGPFHTIRALSRCLIILKQL